MRPSSHYFTYPETVNNSVIPLLYCTTFTRTPEAANTPLIPVYLSYSLKTRWETHQMDLRQRNCSSFLFQYVLKWARLPSYLADGAVCYSPKFIFELKMVKKSFQALWPLNWELVRKELGTFQGPLPSTSTKLFFAFIDLLASPLVKKNNIQATQWEQLQRQAKLFHFFQI